MLSSKKDKRVKGIKKFKKYSGTSSGELWFVEHAAVPCREIKGEKQWKISNVRNPTSNVRISRSAIRISNNPNVTVRIQENKAVNYGL